MSTQSLHWSLLKTTVKIDLAYRFRVLIWMASGCIWVIVYPAIWLSVYGTREIIAGFDHRDLLTYFVCVLVMEYMTQSYVEEDLHEQIRDGKVSSILLKPVDFVTYFFFLHTGFRVLPLTIYLSLTAIAVTVFHLPISWPQHASTIVLLLMALIVGNLLAFNLKMIVSCAAFWLEEAQPVRVLYWISANVFMGWVGPLVFFPLWFQHLSALLPWQYTLYFPVMVFMEKLTRQEVLMGFVIGGVWLIALVLLRRLVLRVSLRRFNAIGH